MVFTLSVSIPSMVFDHLSIIIGQQAAYIRGIN